MPRIGIRPAIDGRRHGVRESLEAQTLAMARSVADLLQSKLRHSNGLAVECVIPARFIGGVAESAETAALFEREGVGLTLKPFWVWPARTAARYTAPMLRIPVFMHNVAEEDIFRPSAWASFGAHDLQGGDFRACANFGPLYGR